MALFNLALRGKVLSCWVWEECQHFHLPSVYFQNCKWHSHLYYYDFTSGTSGELLLCFLRFINVSTYMAKLPWWIQGHSLDFEVHHFHLSRPAPLLSRSIWSTWLTRGGGEQMLPWEKVRPKYLAAATPPLSVVDFHRKSTRWLANWCKFIILYKSSPFLVFIRWKMEKSAVKGESDAALNGKCLKFSPFFYYFHINT